MLKRGERWSNNSVTSTFKVLHKNGRPLGCEKNRTHVFTNSCGLGWRFAIWHDKIEPEIDIFFDAHLASSALGALTVVVMLQSDGSNDEEYVELEEKKVTRESLKLVHLKSWRPQEIAENPQLTFKVSFTATDLDLPPKLQVETLSALERSLQTGVFVDTRFFVFSRRLRLGTVGHPLALFANSTVLQATSSYFRTHLSGTRPPDSPIVDVGLDFVWEGAFTDKYDYESDSDLGDEDPTSSADETQTSATVHEPASDIESRPNAKVTQWPTNGKVLPPAHFQSVGRTILVTDTAFKTWQALILYLYSGNIEFLPLKSQKSLTSALIFKPNRPTTIACSPKSMYRLADKLGHHDLKTLALKSIRDRLSEQNILDEAFSSFTSRYPEIMEIEVNILCRHCRSPGVSDAFPFKVERVAKGELPHSAVILTSLYKTLAQQTPD